MVETVGEFKQYDAHSLQAFTVVDLQASELAATWRRCSLSSDFLARYFSYYFPYREQATDRIDREEAEHTLSYILNELIENTAKYSDTKNQNVRVQVGMTDSDMVMEVSNFASIDAAEAFRTLTREIVDSDPQELYIRKLEENAENDAGASGLGYLTLINDYGVRLGFRFTPGAELGAQGATDAYNVAVQVTLSFKEDS